MRYLCVFGILAFVFYAGSVYCVESPGAGHAGHKEVDVDRNNDGVMDGKDVYDEGGRLVKRGYDDNGDRVMDRWQTYDQNTGLPNIVPSDAYSDIR